MKLTSFSIPSKPSTKIKKPSTFSDEPAEKAEDGLQYVTEFDGSAPLTERPKSVTIPRQENTWRPEKKMKNINLATVDLQFETEDNEEPKTSTEYGLNLRNRVNNSEQQEETTSLARKSVVESIWDQKYKKDIVNLADEDGPEKYEEVPIENFAAAVLSSYGWSEGKGIERNSKADVPVYEHPKRMGGFGAMVDPMTQRQRRHENTMQSRGGGISQIGDTKNATGQELGDQKGEGRKQDQTVSEVSIHDKVDKDGPRKRRHSNVRGDDPHSSYQDKKDRRRNDKRVDRAYEYMTDKRKDDKREKTIMKMVEGIMVQELITKRRMIGREMRKGGEKQSGRK